MGFRLAYVRCLTLSIAFESPVRRDDKAIFVIEAIEPLSASGLEFVDVVANRAKRPRILEMVPRSNGFESTSEYVELLNRIGVEFRQKIVCWAGVIDLKCGNSFLAPNVQGEQPHFQFFFHVYVKLPMSSSLR